MPQVMTTCPFCGCGCGLYLQADDGRVVGVSASGAHPVSHGQLCVKGWHAHEVASSPRRLRTPLLRQNGRLAEASWEEALGAVAERLTSIRRAKGPAAVGALGSSRCTNEDNYLLARFARTALGTNNVDFSARLEALPGLFDLPQYRHLTQSGASLDNMDQADLILLWQTDPAQEHPAVASRLLRAMQRGVRVIEVATRSGQLGLLAEGRLRPRPGADMQLAAGLLNVVLSAAGSGEAEALAASLEGFTPESVAAATGVAAEDLRRVGEAIAEASRPLVVCSRAVTLGCQGPDLLTTLAALGEVGRPNGSSWRSLLWLSQYSNSQGARDMGVVPYFLTGYQSVSDADVRAKFSRAWDAPLPTEPGLSAWDMLSEVRGLFVMGDDPVQVLPDPARARQALADLEFLVVQDIFLSATAQAAHVVLPAASFAEKDGTFTNAERRVQRVRRAVPPPGQARADWEILCDLSGRMGGRMEYGSPAGIMEEVAALTPLYSGISYTTLDAPGGVRLPLSGEAGRPASGLAGSSTSEEAGSVENGAAPTVDDEFPLVLAVDYSLGAWAEDAAVVGSVALRRELQPGRAGSLPVVEMSPADAKRYELRPGEKVRVVSRSGEMQATVHVSDAVCPGVLVIPSGMREAARRVMPPSAHPESGVPMLRPRAVSLRKG